MTFKNKLTFIFTRTRHALFRTEIDFNSQIFLVLILGQHYRGVQRNSKRRGEYWDKNEIVKSLTKCSKRVGKGPSPPPLSTPMVKNIEKKNFGGYSNFHQRYNKKELSTSTTLKSLRWSPNWFLSTKISNLRMKRGLFMSNIWHS